MKIPEEGSAVVATISHQHSLGLSKWVEVVYHDGDNWKPYQGSRTFSDGERVLSWEYAVVTA